MGGTTTVVSSTAGPTTTRTSISPPRRRGKTSRANILRAQSPAIAPIAGQLRQKRIEHTRGLQEAVEKIMAAMERQEELAEKRHDELRTELREIRAENDLLREELRECKEELHACKDTIHIQATNRTTYAAAAARAVEAAAGNESSPLLNHQSRNSPDSTPNTLLSLPEFDLDLTGAYGVHLENPAVKDIQERTQQAFKSHVPSQDIG